MNKPKDYNLAKSFACAFHGILNSLRYERNLRIHFFAACYLLYFSRYYALSKLEYAVLFVSVGVVIACELLNTSVEAAVDLCSPVYSALAKTAKDAAAGAVLMSAAASVAVGFCLFWDTSVIAEIGADIAAAPIVWLFLLAITLFLIAWPERYNKKNNR